MKGDGPTPALIPGSSRPTAAARPCRSRPLGRGIQHPFKAGRRSFWPIRPVQLEELMIILSTLRRGLRRLLARPVHVTRGRGAGLPVLVFALGAASAPATPTEI